MIGAPTTLTTLVQRYHHFSPSFSINNDTASLQSVIVDLRTRQKHICECCVIIGHKADACIIGGPKFLPPSLRININQFNALHGDKKNEPPRECNIQTPSAHFKCRTSPTNTIHVVSAIMGRFNQNAIYNGDIKIPTSYFQLNLTLNQFQIQTPIWLNQLMVMKWIISWNSSIWNMMKIF